MLILLKKHLLLQIVSKLCQSISFFVLIFTQYLWYFLTYSCVKLTQKFEPFRIRKMC